MELPGCVSGASHVMPPPHTWMQQALVNDSHGVLVSPRGTQTPPSLKGGPSNPRWPEPLDKASQHFYWGSCEQKETSIVQQKLTQSCKAIIFPQKTPDTWMRQWGRTGTHLNRQKTGTQRDTTRPASLRKLLSIIVHLWWWMSLEIIIVSGVGQRQISHNITYLWNLNYDAKKLIYKTDSDSQT